MASITTGQEDAIDQQDRSDKRPAQVDEKNYGFVPQGRITSHSNLERDIHMRYWAEQALVGRTLTLVGDEIHVEPAIDLHDPAITPPWTNDSSKTLSKVSLFTATSKMGAPSYSIPVGPPAFGGSCPGSIAGMTTAPKHAYRAQKKRVLKVLNATNKMRPVYGYRAEDAVCQNCYVAKGNHASYWGNNLRIVIRYAWTRAAVAQGMFATSIIEALRGHSFPQDPPAIAEMGQHYFRIHDAGDFYDKSYLAEWWKVAKAFDGRTPGFPRVIFWAPTRIWATPWGKQAVYDVNGGDRFLDNFVIRPSGYVIDAPGPDFPIGPATGFASPTTVDRGDTVRTVKGRKIVTKGHQTLVVEGKVPRTFDWPCPAQHHNGSCLESPSPAGTLGCRVCWIHPHLRTSYALH